MTSPTDFPTLSEASDLPAPQFAELCRDDLERRWRAGEHIAVETYFERFPTTFDDTESSLLLIYSEYLLRERNGEQPSPAEYHHRFPRFGDLLRVQFQLHSALGSEAAGMECDATGEWGSMAETDLELFEELGRGGMGIVLRGHDHVLDRDLAVKVLRPGQFEERFFSEARIGGRLQHPGIVPVHQFGRLADGRPFFTMKLVDGSTLATMLAERPNPQDRRSEFIRIFEKVCQTVAFAHENGVIHRDLKPANVMVGHYGEVQVMDWGLAKLKGKAVGGGRSELPPPAFRPPPSTEEETQNGAIIGTPGYMAPEQAGGGAEPDARSDVFGLGAMLCEILTGQPPFSGTDRAALLAQTTRGELSPAMERIDRCGADSDLIALAKSCLAVDPDNRPDTAAEVAKAISAHAAGTEARLRQAELVRAAAESRSLADRRAQKLTAGLAFAGVAFAVLLAVGTIWYQRDRVERVAEQQRKAASVEQEIRVELQKATELDLQARGLVNDPPRWEAALAGALSAARRASHLSRAEDIPIDPRLQAEVASTMTTVEDDERDRQLVATLEAIRMVPTGFYDEATTGDRFHAAPKYRAAFAAGGLDAPGASMSMATEWLTRRPPFVRAALMAMLDDWLAGYAYDDTDSTAIWLRDVLRAVETDPWMARIRDIRYRPQLALNDLNRLVDEADLTAHPPAAYYLLAMDLSAAGDTRKAIAFLRRAQLHHPGDFWLNFLLGRKLSTIKQHSEAIGYYQAARVARPNDPGLLSNLGNVLHYTHAWDSAEEVFRQALRLDPKLVSIHIGLGMVRRAKGDLPSALEHYRHAIDLDPAFYISHQGLANVLTDQNDYPSAIASCERALKLNPNDQFSYFSLGDAFARQKDWPRATIAWRKAVELDPDNNTYHRHLGWALKAQNDWPGAAAAYRRAIELVPDDVEAFRNLGDCLKAVDDWNGAAGAYRKAIVLEPKHAKTFAILGLTLRFHKDLQGSLAALQRACELDDADSWTHLQLAYTYRALKDPPRALGQLNRSLELDPKNFDRLFAIAHEMMSMGYYASAERTFRRCLELSPDNPQAHCNLGHVLRHRGKFEDSVASLRRGHELGTQQKGWSHPSEDWLRESEALRDLEKRLPVASAASAVEQFDMAKLVARYHRNYAEATRLALESFAKDPKLMEGRRIDAARWAALAAGTAKSEAGRLPHRRQSREWLRAEFDTPALTPGAAAARKGLLHAPEFAAFRDDAFVYKLPETERTAWRKLWDDLRNFSGSSRPMVGESGVRSYSFGSMQVRILSRKYSSSR